MMRKIFFLFGLLVSSLCASAQSVSFKAIAPAEVVVGQNFRLTYVLEADADGKDIRIPEYQGFDLIAGPFEASSGSSTTIINGNVSTRITKQYTVTLNPKAEGTFKIPEATIKVKNSQYKSNELTIKVLPNDGSARPGRKNSDDDSNQPQASSGSNISSNDVFMRMIISKNSVYENEGFLVTFKLYSLYDVNGFQSVKFPDFEGFISQEIELPQNTAQLSLENYNGRNYRTAIIKQNVLFPQRSGQIKIEPGKFELVMRVRTQQQIRSIFDDFFDSYTTVIKPVTSSGTTIDVKPLPSGKPASFSGAVGDYTLTSSISPDKLKANESVTIKVNISGTGNIKLITNPTITFPNDFETYEPKVDLNTKVGANGVSGSKSIEYLAIPRFAGDFVIPSTEFSYFDTKTGTYKTLKTQEFKLHVDKGSDNGSGQPVFSTQSNKENVKFLGKDIRYIKTGSFSYNKKADFFFGKFTYTLAYLIPALLFIIFFILYRKQAKENANIALVRTKKANKMASKRLKVAGQFLKENKKEEFYDEVLKALWGYLSDKLNIPVASLTKDNVETELEKYGVDESLVRNFLDILNTCEFARFAPSQDTHEMDKLYDATIQAIDKMENTIKK